MRMVWTFTQIEGRLYDIGLVPEQSTLRVGCGFGVNSILT